MSCDTLAESPSESRRGGDLTVGLDQATERMGLEDVVRKIIKYTKVRAFDGYLALEEARANWKFLEAVGEGVKAATATGSGKAGKAGQAGKSQGVSVNVLR